MERKKMYRKIVLAVDCDSEQEQQMVQKIAEEISSTFKMKAREIIDFYPFVQKNQGVLYAAVKTMGREGKRGLPKLIPLLMKL